MFILVINVIIAIAIEDFVEGLFLRKLAFLVFLQHIISYTINKELLDSNAY